MISTEGERGTIGGSERFRLAASTASPHGADGVDDEARPEREGRREACFARRATDSGPELGNGTACCEELGARGSVDGAVHTAAAQHPLVRSVDDRIDGELGDVTGDDGQAGHAVIIPKPRGFRRVVACMSKRGSKRARAGALAALTLGSFAGCASAPDAVLDVGARNLQCGRSELEVALNRETPSVREYAVACNFMYTLVHCTDRGCRPASVKPPCVGNLPCFEEDPETLEWKLAGDDTAARTHASSGAKPAP